MTDMTHIPSLHIPFNLVARGCILVFARSIPFQAFQSKSFLSPTLSTLSGAVRIISADGTVLDPTLPIDRAGLQSGDTVTAVALPPAKLLPLCFKTFSDFQDFQYFCAVFLVQCKLTQHTQHGSTCIFTGEELDSVPWLPTGSRN